tara:strand:- start:1384 stop:3588 length:2205 start_codon:yes stop_codon:yes gene_type:complete
METITHEIRGSVAINLADQIMFKEHFGLPKRYAKAAAKAVSAKEFKGFKPEDLIGYSKIVKAMPGVGVKTVEKLEKAGAFKTVFYIVMNVGKTSYRIPGFYETVEGAQAAYALEVSTKEAVRPIQVKTLPANPDPDIKGKVAEKYWKDRQGASSTLDGPKEYVPGGVYSTSEKTTVGKMNLDKRLKQIELKHLKKDGPSWVIDVELVAAVGTLEPKPAMKEKSYKVVDTSDLPLSPLSYHCFNRGVIGLGDMAIEFGAQAFSRANRSFCVEHADVNKNGEVYHYFTHHASWHKHHGFNWWRVVGSHKKPQACELQVEIPKEVEHKVFGDLRKAQYDDPMPRKNNDDPNPNDDLKDYQLMLDLVKLSSMAGRVIAYEESEGGYAVDHDSVNYPTSFRAFRKDENPNQETLNRMNEGQTSSSTIDEKADFWVRAESAYYSPEYQLVLKAKKLPGHSPTKARAKDPEIEVTREKMFSLPPGEERNALRTKLKKLQSKPKVVNNLVDCSKFFKSLNSEEKDVVIEILNVKLEKENYLKPQDLRRLHKKIARNSKGVAFMGQCWEEEATRKGGLQRANVYWTAMSDAMLDDTTDVVMLSAVYKGDQVLEEHVHKDEVQDQLDCSQEHEQAERYYAEDAVIHQQTVGFLDKKENTNAYEVALTSGVPAFETQVRMPDGSLFTTMAEAIKPEEDRVKLRAELTSFWERQGEIPGDNGLNESDDDTFNPMAELFDSQETEEE